MCLSGDEEEFRHTVRVYSYLNERGMTRDGRAVPLLGAVQDRWGSYYLIFPHLGARLGDDPKGGGVPARSLEEVKRDALPFVRQLMAFHENDVVHCDVSARNVVGGQLVDFGSMSCGEVFDTAQYRRDMATRRLLLLLSTVKRGEKKLAIQDLKTLDCQQVIQLLVLMVTQQKLILSPSDYPGHHRDAVKQFNSDVSARLRGLGHFGVTATEQDDLFGSYVALLQDETADESVARATNRRLLDRQAAEAEDTGCLSGCFGWFGLQISVRARRQEEARDALGLRRQTSSFHSGLELMTSAIAYRKLMDEMSLPVLKAFFKQLKPDASPAEKRFLDQLAELFKKEDIVMGDVMRLLVEEGPPTVPDQQIKNIIQIDEEGDKVNYSVV